MRLAPLALCCAALLSARAGAAPAVDASDEQVLKEAHVETTPAALLAFVRHRVSPTPEKAVLLEEARHLADKDAVAANRASGRLLGYGPAAIPVLRLIANDADQPEAAERARKALHLLEGAGGASVTQAVVRALGTLQPDGTVEALLAFVPYAEDAQVVKEIESALAVHHSPDGKPDPALVAALADKVPVRRVVAASALCRDGGHYALVRPLLKDERATVRLEVAQALVAAHDAEAVPVLIDLLGELPADRRQDVETQLTDLAGEWAVGVPHGEDPTARRLRRNLWLAWWASMEPARLLDEVQSRTPDDADRTRALEILAKLESPDAAVRDKAGADLLALSPAIVPVLRQASHSGNARVAAEANRCLLAVNPDRLVPLPTAAPRLLALRRPAGTVAALLGYLPYAEDEGSAQRLRVLLGEIGCPEGKADPALVKALTDPLPVRRAAAASALCQGHAREHLEAVHALLADPDVDVRLRAALGLAVLRDKRAVPAVIALLTELPPERAAEAEDFLVRVAGSAAPDVSATGTPDQRAKARDAWSAWWKQAGDTVDLAPASTLPRHLGYLLSIEPAGVGRGGRVCELDQAGKVRWEIDNLLYPVDAEVLPGDRVLIAEMTANRVTERDFKGNVVWEKAVPTPLRVQRLANGNTFIGSRQMLVEVDRTGKELYTVTRAGDNMVASCKYRDGTIGVLNYRGIYTRMNTKGEEIRSLQLAVPLAFGITGVTLTQANTAIICSQGLNKVAEYDLTTGKALWEATVQQPTSAAKLADGHTLILSQGFGRLTEVDRAGKLLSEKPLTTRPIRIARR